MSTRLHQLGAITTSELERVGSLVPELGTANRALYEILVVDPNEKKLKHLSTALKEDTSRGNHKELAELIDKYLASKLYLSSSNEWNIIYIIIISLYAL